MNVPLASGSDPDPYAPGAQALGGDALGEPLAPDLAASRSFAGWRGGPPEPEHLGLAAPYPGVGWQAASTARVPHQGRNVSPDPFGASESFSHSLPLSYGGLPRAPSTLTPVAAHPAVSRRPTADFVTPRSQLSQLPGFDYSYDNALYGVEYDLNHAGHPDALEDRSAAAHAAMTAVARQERDVAEYVANMAPDMRRALSQALVRGADPLAASSAGHPAAAPSHFRPAPRPPLPTGVRRQVRSMVSQQPPQPMMARRVLAHPRQADPRGVAVDAPDPFEDLGAPPAPAAWAPPPLGHLPQHVQRPAGVSGPHGGLEARSALHMAASAGHPPPQALRHPEPHFFGYDGAPARSYSRRDAVPSVQLVGERTPPVPPGYHAYAAPPAPLGYPPSYPAAHQASHPGYPGVHTSHGPSGYSGPGTITSYGALELPTGHRVYDVRRAHDAPPVGEAPSFTATISLLHNHKYLADVATYVAKNPVLLQVNPNAAITIFWYSCKSSPARRFIIQHRDILDQLSPGSGEALDKLIQAASVTAVPRPALAGPTTSAHQEALNDLESFAKKAVGFSSERGTFGQHPPVSAHLQELLRIFAGKPLTFHDAFCKLVEWTLCVPTPSELSIWEQGMRMGHPNELDPQVHKDETPTMFIHRVLETKVFFSKYAVNGSDLWPRTISPPLYIVLKGMPRYISNVVEEELKRHHSGEEVSTMERLKVADRIAMSLWTASATERTHAGVAAAQAAQPPPPPTGPGPARAAAAAPPAAQQLPAAAADPAVGETFTPPAAHDRGDRRRNDGQRGGRRERHGNRDQPDQSQPVAMSAQAVAPHHPALQQGRPSGYTNNNSRQQYASPRSPQRASQPFQRERMGQPGGRANDNTCRGCGKEGHWVADCPDRNPLPKLTTLIERLLQALPAKAPAASGQPAASAGANVGARALAAYAAAGAAAPAASAASGGTGSTPSAAATAAAQPQTQRPASVAMPQVQPVWPLVHADAMVSFITFGPAEPAVSAPPESPPSTALAAHPRPPTMAALGGEAAGPVAASAATSQPAQAVAPHVAGGNDLQLILSQLATLTGRVQGMLSSSCPGQADGPGARSKDVGSDLVGAASGVATYREGKRFPKGFSAMPPALFEPAAQPATQPKRPEPFAVDADSQPPTLAESVDRMKANGRLRYFRNSGPLAECVGLVTGTTLTVRGLRVMADDGANAHLITRNTCMKLGIPIEPCAMKLTSCTAHNNPVVGITPPIQVVYGVGRPDAVKVWHHFIVTEGMDSVYNVLLGNADTNAYGAIIDAGTNLYTLRTHFDTLNVRSPTLSLPTMLAPPARREEL